MIIHTDKTIIKLFPTGAYTNEAGITIGNADNLITINKETISLWGLALRQSLSYTEIDSKDIEDNIVTDFDFFNGILYCLGKRTGHLQIFKTIRNIVPAALFDIRNQYKHSLEEIYNGRITIEAEVISINCFIKNKAANIIELIVVENNGISVYKVGMLKGKNEASLSQIERSKELLANLQSIIYSYESKSIVVSKETIKEEKKEVGCQTEEENKSNVVKKNIREYVIQALCKEITTIILPFLNQKTSILTHQFREKIDKEVERYKKVRRQYEHQMNTAVC